MAARPKGEKVTFVIPHYLLELADLQADQFGVDRYDVIRMALGQGLMVLKLNQQLQQNPERYIDELRALTNSDPGAHEKLHGKLEDDAVADIASSLQRKRPKRDRA